MTIAVIADNKESLMQWAKEFEDDLMWGGPVNKPRAWIQPIMTGRNGMKVMEDAWKEAFDKHNNINQTNMSTVVTEEGKETTAPLLTYGQKAVGVNFNHGEGKVFFSVKSAKQGCADLIDQMNDLRAKSESGEYKALATIAIRKLQSAQMDMVKAITWKD